MGRTEGLWCAEHWRRSAVGLARRAPLMRDMDSPWPDHSVVIALAGMVLLGVALGIDQPLAVERP